MVPILMLSSFHIPLIFEVLNLFGRKGVCLLLSTTGFDKRKAVSWCKIPKLFNYRAKYNLPFCKHSSPGQNSNNGIYLDLFVLQKQYENSNQKRSRVGWAVVDTLIWQGLASVAIPGFTINRICTFTGVLLKRGVSWPGPARKWVTTAVGLLSIPIIIKPIDKSVDYLMENTLRRWYHVGPVLKELVHHNRNDWPELDLEILDWGPFLPSSCP